MWVSEPPDDDEDIWEPPESLLAGYPLYFPKREPDGARLRHILMCQDAAHRLWQTICANIRRGAV